MKLWWGHREERNSKASVGNNVRDQEFTSFHYGNTMVLKLGLDRTVQLGKLRTGHFYGLFNMKNRSMQKKAVTHTDRGLTARFCEP